MGAYYESMKLRASKGMRGFGVYVRLIELCEESEDGVVAFDYETIAWDMRERVALVKQVVEDYGLFVITPTGFKLKRSTDNRCDGDKQTSPSPTQSVASDCCKTLAIEQKHSDMSESAMESDSAKQINSNIENSASKLEFDTGEPADEEIDASEPSAWEILRSKWNTVFAGTRRVVNDLIVSSQVMHELSQTLNHYSVDEIAETFEEAKKDQSWAWQLSHVVKEKNVRTLLTRIEQRKNRAQNEERRKIEAMGDREREYYNYCKEHGISWDGT